MDKINHEWYSSERAVEEYGSHDYLEPSLILILIKYREHIVDEPVLDIGVGAGRTTLYLSFLTRGYVGIDYSETMVDHCRRRFPSARVELCDARALERFADASFRMVIFSANGIGAIGHDDRLHALAEITRVLRPGGIFAFSAHNRNYTNAREGPHLLLSRNPFTLVHNAVRWLRQLRNHRRMRRHELNVPEFALVNDLAEEFSLLHYYIAREEQGCQLERFGLEVVEMYDNLACRILPAGDDRLAPWIWYVARKRDQVIATAGAR